ncbi:MAG: MBOAT family protein [Verrucomicrobiaceae bacterium]|nr:MBOAT family protein [Verrucomicrobiaceae bacterium]
MWFNSFAFWIFFIVVLCIHAPLPHRKRNLWLLVASYFFYGCWDWRFLGLIALTTAFEFFSAQQISRSDTPRIRRAWVTASLVLELGILCLFKYFNFFVREMDRLLESFGLNGWHPAFHILLPAGISFFTFQALSYTIDVYRGKTKPARSLFDFALYVSFFPQLVAGPIERSSHLLPQVENPRPTVTHRHFQEGLYHVLTGLFKKIVVADNMAWLANHIFARPPESLSAPEVLLGTYAFAFQIYGDFSGYSSIAIGVARWLGFDLMDNFRQPYLAISPQDFWKRWHISLSSWLRDYLYIPLGGNRGSKWFTARNLLLTMFLGGLWHGAAWTYIIWGGIHGLWLVLDRFFRRPNTPSLPAWRNALSIFITFHLVCLAWLFFRADSASQATIMLSQLLGPWTLTPFTSTALTLIAFYAGPWIVFDLWIDRQTTITPLLEVSRGVRSSIYLFIILAMLFFPPPVPVEFIYFRF